MDPSTEVSAGHDFLEDVLTLSTLPSLIAGRALEMAMTNHFDLSNELPKGLTGLNKRRRGKQTETQSKGTKRPSGKTAA